MGGFVFNDGGREDAGYKGTAGDCVCRAISIATGKPYKEVYDDLNKYAKSERTGKKKRGISSARNGMYKQTYKKYLADLGWEWIPTMEIGSGCKVHLCPNELPSGTLIISLSKHLTVMIDGVIHDTYDPRRYKQGDTVGYKNGEKYVTPHGAPSRCVYGYFRKKKQLIPVKSTAKELIDDGAFGICPQCKFEFNSELINEYVMKYCLNCGQKLNI